MRYLKFLALGALLIMWGLPLQAAQMNGLYEAEGEVPDQGRATRAKAMREAMAAVLLKVSGRASVLEEEAIKKAMNDASHYVQQYRYRNAGDNGAGGGGLMLWVGFDGDSIDKLLSRFGFNVWGATRPSTLAWIVVDDGSQRSLVGANDQGLVRNLLEAEAQRRAIPVRLPLLDLTDQSKVRASDVWGGFFDNIKEASQRYESQAILVGKFYQAGRSWEAHWTLFYQGGQHKWQNSSARVSEVIAGGVDGTADYLSSYFRSTSYTGQEQLLLNVSAVSGLAGYRRVSDYLLSLHGVSTVTLRRVDSSSASFLLDIKGGRDALLQAIRIGDVLVAVEQPSQPLIPATAQSTVSAKGTMPVRPGAASSGGATNSVLRQPATMGPAGEEMKPDMESGEPAGEAGMLMQQLQTPPPEELFFRLLP